MPLPAGRLEVGTAAAVRRAHDRVQSQRRVSGFLQWDTIYGERESSMNGRFSSAPVIRKTVNARSDGRIKPLSGSTGRDSATRPV